VEKIRESARKVCVGSAFSTAQVVLQRRRSVIRITTGSKELDAILGGGVETGSLTEIFGEFRTGKTQLVHTMCVTCQLARESGGGAGKVIVVDTEGTFRPERVAEIATKRFHLDADEVLDNIRISRVFNVDDQVDANLAIAALLADDDAPTRLIIIDSVTNLWRQDYVGRGELSERQQRLNSYLADLKRICEEFNVAVILSNQVMANPDSSMVCVLGGWGVGRSFCTAMSLIPLLRAVRGRRLQEARGWTRDRARVDDARLLPQGQGGAAHRQGRRLAVAARARSHLLRHRGRRGRRRVVRVMHPNRATTKE
jgi:RecA/RadA recombinase